MHAPDANQPKDQRAQARDKEIKPPAGNRDVGVHCRSRAGGCRESSLITSRLSMVKGENGVHRMGGPMGWIGDHPGVRPPREELRRAPPTPGRRCDDAAGLGSSEGEEAIARRPCPERCRAYRSSAVAAPRRSAWDGINGASPPASRRRAPAPSHPAAAKAPSAGTWQKPRPAFRPTQPAAVVSRGRGAILVFTLARGAAPRRWRGRCRANQVGERKRPHGMIGRPSTIALSMSSTVPRPSASAKQASLRKGISRRLTMKPGTSRAVTTSLPSALGELNRRRIRRVAGLQAAMISTKGRDRHRVHEVHADDLLGALGGGSQQRDRIDDVFVARIALATSRGQSDEDLLL